MVKNKVIRHCYHKNTFNCIYIYHCVQHCSQISPTTLNNQLTDRGTRVDVTSYCIFLGIFFNV